MPKVITDAQHYTDIANAIRAKNGESVQYLPSEMAGKIAELPTEAAIVDQMISGKNFTALYNDRVTTVRNFGFYGSPFTIVELPKVVSLGQACFQWSALTRAILPAYQYGGTTAFGNCTALESIELPDAGNIPAQFFNNCTALKTVVIGTNNPGVCALQNTNAFSGTPIASGTGYIYVPDSLVSGYKAATNWSTYASQIKGVSELPEV